MDYAEISTTLINTVGYYFFFGILGAVMGSFAGVLIYRIPDKISIKSRSRCNSCEYFIPLYRNIPIISWIVQRGRCRNCKARIPFTVVSIELISVVGYLLAAWLTSDPIAALAYAMVITFSLVIGAIDWKTTFIPVGVLVGFGGAAWLLTFVWGGVTSSWNYVLLGIIIGFGWWVFLELINALYYLVRKQHGLGGGDGMLMLVACGVAAALSGSWIVGLYGGFLGFTLAIFGIMIPALRVKEPVPQIGDEEAWAEAQEKGETIEYELMQTPIAYGPYLLAGPVIVWTLMKLLGML